MPELAEPLPIEQELEDEQRIANIINELVEQGGLAPAADDPFTESAQTAARMTVAQMDRAAYEHGYREARQLEHLINQGDLTTTETSQASAQEIADIIKHHFNAKYQLPLKPAHVKDQREIVETKEPGHYAEDAIIRILNESGLKVYAEHGSDYQDAIGKADILLFIPIAGGEVMVKVQTKTKASAAELVRLPANALLVEHSGLKIPYLGVGDERETTPNDRIIALAEKGNAADKKNFATGYLRLVLGALQHSPRNVYPAAKEALGLA